MSGGGSASGYVIERSLRFSSASSNYLTRTFSTPTNNTVWTWSKWLKRGSLGSIQCLFSAGSAGVFFNASDQLIFTSNAGATLATSTKVFRDPSAHGHLKVSSDGTTITAHWNNELCLSYTGTITNINSAIAHNIGRNAGGSNHHFDGYDSEDVFVDGQSLASASFGEVNQTTGQWVAKKYTGTYGTNGFYLDFKDGTSTTTLGDDKSGNNNDWTLTNFARSAGVNDCWMLDVPSGNGSASAVQPSGNYAVLNPLNKGVNVTLTKANLRWACPSLTGSNVCAGTSIGMTSGIWYCEAQDNIGQNPVVGINRGDVLPTNLLGGTADSWGYYLSNGNKYTNTISTAYAVSSNSTNIIGILLDLNARTLTFYRDGVPLGVAFSGLPDGVYYFATGNSGTLAASCEFNFGQRSFAYTPPAGAKALCTANLTSTDVIESGSFTGNASADGRHVWCNGTPETLTINGNAVTWGTHADRLSNGFKLRTSSSSYNSSGTNTWTATILSPESKSAFKHQNAKGN